MTRSERYKEKPKSYFKIKSIILVFFCISLFTLLYFYFKNQIIIEAPKQELGQKVIIQLPSGENVFTYENLIVEENGKLVYKGERNTLDFTGGVVVYEDWE